MSLIPPSVDENAGRTGPHDDIASLRPASVTLDSAGHVGEALRQARESLGLDIDDIALVTKVRAAYIAALVAYYANRHVPGFAAAADRFAWQ